MTNSVSNGSALELLIDFILHGANARLLYVEAATADHPTLVHFCADMPGQPPACVLPASELCQHKVRLELAKFHTESIEEVS